MKNLNQLRREAQDRDDWQSNPRPFMATFPSGVRTGRFLDPFLGAILIDGMDGVVSLTDLDHLNIPAMWLDSE